MVWTQCAVDTVCSGRSGIVVYGDWDIVWVQKGQTSGCSGPSTQWRQYTADAVK